MKHLFLILFCAFLFACAQPKADTNQDKLSNLNSTVAKPGQLSKEDQLINLLSDKIVDSINGETENAENLVTIENLIKQGVDVNTRDKSTFQTPLMFAVQNGRPSALRLLLNAKANPNLQDDTGRTALMGAASTGDLVMVKLLLEKGADKKIEDNDGFTALSGSEYSNGVESLEPKEKYAYFEIRRLLQGSKK